MRLRTITRGSAIGAIASLLIASWLTFLAPSASALTRDGFEITLDEVVTREYPPIAGNNPAGEAHTPEICATSAYCDVVPFTVVVPPSIAPDDEYFVQLEVAWSTDRAPGDPVLEPEGYTLNDMDFYVYTDPPTAEEAESRGHAPDSESDPTITDGAGGSTPERAFLFKPRGGYLIVINNFLGANTGYTVTATWFTESIPTPFEKLAEEFKPVATTTTTTTTPTTTTTTIAPPPTVETQAPVTLAPVDIDVDSDFDPTEFGDDDFESALAAPQAINVEPVSATAPAPPSGLALFFWMLAVPLGTVALGGTVLLRRRATL